LCLGGHAKIHDEEQGSESDKFCSAFDKFTVPFVYQKGLGTATGFRHTVPGGDPLVPKPKRLYRVRRFTASGAFVPVI
jgi:hypothetical protein